MDFAALPGLFEGIRTRAEAAAVPAAGAMGKAYKGHLVDVTLMESGSHPPVTETPSSPGSPPAMMTGRLRGSVAMTGPYGGGGIGESSVAPHTVYAVTQEYGEVHHAVKGPYMWLWLRYAGPAEVARRHWLKETVDIPERSYMRRAVRETIADGSIRRAAEEAFAAIVWGG